MTAAAVTNSTRKAPAPRRRRQPLKPQAFCGLLLASVGRRRSSQRQERPEERRELRQEVLKLQASVEEMQQQVQVAARAIKQLHGLVALLAAQRQQARGE